MKKSFVSVETIKNIRNNLKPVEDVGVKAETEEREAVKLVGDVNGESDHVKNYNTGEIIFVGSCFRWTIELLGFFFFNSNKILLIV